MHATADKTKLLARVRRIRGQVEALERALDNEVESEKLLHLIAGARGAISGLMGEVVEHHIRHHLTLEASDAIDPAARQALIDVFHAYIK
jgi:DNA-binding FrmR family transcriptional regulator